MRTQLDMSVLSTMLREQFECGALSRAEYDAAQEDLNLVIRRQNNGR